MLDKVWLVGHIADHTIPSNSVIKKQINDFIFPMESLLLCYFVLLFIQVLKDSLKIYPQIVKIIYNMAMTLALVTCLFTIVHATNYAVDDTVGIARQYDGIGGLSGGSATSKLLIGYPQKQRDEILDYLFKPNFGASLQILKVEIGGDAQASDATEASHMHVEWEENYERGYEWWLMKEAKLRNSKIKLYGLPWAFPGWLGNGTQSPYIDNHKLADYIFKWIRGAEVYHGLFIDFIGIWNERWCDTGYVKVLRQTLDQNGYENVRIVASDLDFGIVDFVKADTALASVVDYIGAHYPGVLSPDDAKELGIPLWSSEDFSTYNDETGGGCWARILNQNYVQGLMTSTIAWNLIDSFFQGLPWDRTSLMTAREPWSGNYIVESPIWMSAHTTQLTEIGWSYLPHSHGVGMLKSGGSYVSLVSPDLKDFTIVVETMSHDHSVCIRPPLPHYTVETQVVTFTLAGSFASVKSLNVWQSQLKFGANETSTYFQSLGSVPVVDGAVSLTVGVDEIYSLTTLSTGYHGKHPDPPESAPFPLPFVEDFEKYPLSAEPYILAPQQGSFDVVDVGGDHGKVMRQMVLQPPIAWCQDTLRLNSSLNLFGRFNWTDVEVDVDMNVGEINGTNAVYLGVRIDNAGCGTDTALGIFLFITPKDNSFKLTNDIKGQKILLEGKNQSAIQSGWNKVSLTVQGQTAVASVNGVKLFNTQIPSTPANGFVGVGTDIYGYADFDNIYVHNTTTWSHKHHIQSQPLYFVKEEIH